MAVLKRSAKGASLTHAEMDANLQELINLQSGTGGGAFAVGALISTNGTVQTTVSYAGVLGVLGTLTDHDLQIISNSVERARITAGGNVLIGTATDNGTGAKLQVAGGVTALAPMKFVSGNVWMGNSMDLAAGGTDVNQGAVRGDNGVQILGAAGVVLAAFSATGLAVAGDTNVTGEMSALYFKISRPPESGAPPAAIAKIVINVDGTNYYIPLSAV